MRILTIHNYYQQAGGEDVVFEGEAALLREHGHDVVQYRQDNKRLHTYSRLTIAARAMWSQPVYRDLQHLLREVEPHIVHVHNTFPLISPAVYYASRAAGVPVVQTLHNYRMLCPAATLLRDGQLCEQCLEKTYPWPAVLHACYHDSAVQSAVSATTIAVHRWLGTWRQQIDLYIALTEFSRRKFIEGGLPEAKVVVKPNFVHPDPGCRDGGGRHALFVGRLSPEKGIQTLLQAWQQAPHIPLHIVGDGPLWPEVQAFLQTSRRPDIVTLGQRPPMEVMALLHEAQFLVVPSEWYETFGRVAIEAFACGVPVLAARLGAMAELVEDGRTGLLFRAGDAADLAAKVGWAVAHPEAMAAMGRQARQRYEAQYTAERNYTMLMRIYAKATDAAWSRRS